MTGTITITRETFGRLLDLAGMSPELQDTLADVLAVAVAEPDQQPAESPSQDGEGWGEVLRAMPSPQPQYTVVVEDLQTGDHDAGQFDTYELAHARGCDLLADLEHFPRLTGFYIMKRYER